MVMLLVHDIDVLRLKEERPPMDSESDRENVSPYQNLIVNGLSVLQNLNAVSSATGMATKLTAY